VIFVSNIAVQFGAKPRFSDVSVEFCGTPEPFTETMAIASN